MIKEIVNEAYNFAKKKHEGQFRKKTKIPYFVHPKYVSKIIEKITHDPEMVAASLLHDTIEDTDATIEEIDNKFGKRVACLVDELTNKDEKRAGRKKKHYMYEKFRELSSDALLIKLADRFHNILFLKRDCSDKENMNFIKYYYENTIFILDKIQIEPNMKDKVKTEHIILLNSIYSVLNFLKFIYKF